MAIFAGNLYFLPQSHLPFNYEKVKACHGKVNTSDYNQKSMINLTQFEATFGAKS